MASSGGHPRWRWAVVAGIAGAWTAVVLVAAFPDVARHALRLAGRPAPRRSEELGRFELPGDVDPGRLADGAWAVVGAAYLAWVALALGRRLTSLGRVGRRTGSWDALVDLVLGLGAIALVMTAMGVAHLLRPAAIGVLMALLGMHALVTAWREGVRPSPSRLLRGRRPGWLPWTAALVAGVFALVALIGALWPEVEFDAVWFHLWLPQQDLAAGRLADHPDEYIALYPREIELLYGWGLVWGGVTAAKLVNLLIAVLTLGATWGLARRMVPARWAAVAVALVVSTPIVLWEMTTAYSDVAVALAATLMAGELLDWRASGERRRLVRAALILGIGLAAKHLALILVPPALLLVLTARVAGPRLRARVGSGALFVGICLAVPAPWYLRSALITGNPVFPELYGVLGAPADRWNARTDAGLQRFLEHFGPDRTPWELLRLPWTVTTQPDRFDGSIGPVFLALAPLAVLALVRRPPPGLRALAALTGGYLVLWASPLCSFQARFLVVAVPLLAVLGVAGLHALTAGLRTAGMPRLAAVAAVVPLVMVLANLPPFAPWHGRVIAEGPGYAVGYVNNTVRDVELAAAVDDEAADAMLDRRIRGMRAVRFANAELPAGSRILSEVGAIHLWSRHPLLMSYTVTGDRALERHGPDPGAAMAAALEELGIDAVLVDRRGYLGEAIAPLGDRLEPLYEDDEVVLYGLAGSESQRTGGRSGAPPDGEPSISSS